MNKYQEQSLFGFWLYILSDCVLFATLFAVFAVLRGQTYGGITGDELLNLPFLLGETLILLASSYAIGFAVTFANSSPKNVRSGPLGQVQPIFWSLLASLFLGFTFLCFELHEFHSLIATGNGPGRSAFLSAFFTLVGTHGLHVFVGMLWMGVLMYFINKRGLTPANYRKLRMLALFWHFLDIIWIFIFTIVYLLTAAL